tara:strand:+ start:328 stop:825 length:498 start_codon:yes stop_codon:yes gene_type:complete
MTIPRGLLLLVFLLLSVIVLYLRLLLEELVELTGQSLELVLCWKELKEELEELEELEEDDVDDCIDPSTDGAICCGCDGAEAEGFLPAALLSRSLRFLALGRSDEAEVGPFIEDEATNESVTKEDAASVLLLSLLLLLLLLKLEVNSNGSSNVVSIHSSSELSLS